MPVRVVTDSTADLPPELAADLGITVVPLLVLFGGETLRDGVDITTGEFYRRLASAKTLPTTSQPSVGDFEAAYARLAEETTGIVSIHLSGKLSGTVGAAAAATTSFPHCTIEVIDSESASFGCGIAVARAAQAAKAGARLPEVCAIARQVIASQTIIFTVDTLEYLRRGGRIGRAAAFLGSVLSIKPILGIRDGEIYPIERVRTRKRAIDRLYERTAELESVTDIAIMHSTTPGEAEELGARLVQRFPNAHFWTGKIGPVLGVHAGPGVIGVAAVSQAAGQSGARGEV